MPLPFPGMNPYLEQNDVWEDFHRRFLVVLAADLESRVGPNYLVKIEARLYLRELSDRRLVTVVELLSPTNKARGPDRDDYLRKRKQVLYGSAHFVEIDLLRGGLRPEPPEFPTADYYAFVSRATERSNGYWWRMALRDRLPVIPVPLAVPDGDVLVDLQAILHRTYDEAGYGKYIYDEKPQPPLNGEDEKWAQGILAARSFR